MAKIFYGENDDRDFSNPDKYAFLNWRMDDGIGRNYLEPNIQMVSDNYYMGRGYLGNALLSLYLLIEKNKFGVADIVIFPILFNIWHGMELWLKSSCRAIEIIFDESIIKKKNHNIYDYYNCLHDFIKNRNFHYINENALVDLAVVIDEFRKVDANFDFARYSFDNNGNYQFYNAPYGNDKQWQKNYKGQEESRIVPNTCLDLAGTFEMVLYMFISFGRFVECLNLVLDSGDTLSDQGYRNYINALEKTEELFEIDEKKDIWEKLIDIIN